MNTINEAHLYIVLHSYDWHMQIAYTFVRYFTFLTVLTVNFCATTSKFLHGHSYAALHFTLLRCVKNHTD